MFSKSQKWKKPLVFFLDFSFVFLSVFSGKITTLMMENLEGCKMYEKFGIKCLTCGGTRCVNAIANGKIKEAFLYNSFVGKYLNKPLRWQYKVREEYDLKLSYFLIDEFIDALFSFPKGTYWLPEDAKYHFEEDLEPATEYALILPEGTEGLFGGKLKERYIYVTSESGFIFNSQNKWDYESNRVNEIANEDNEILIPFSRLSEETLFTINIENNELTKPLKEVDKLLKANKATVEVLSSSDKWFGVTYKEDRPVVVERLQQLTKEGLYPSPLF